MKRMPVLLRICRELYLIATAMLDGSYWTEEPENNPWADAPTCDNPAFWD